MLRWSGVTVSAALLVAASAGIIVGLGVGPYVMLVTAILLLLALLPTSPRRVVFELATFSNGLLFLFGVFAIPELGKYDFSAAQVTIVWAATLFAPVVNWLALLSRRNAFKKAAT